MPTGKILSCIKIEKYYKIIKRFLTCTKKYVEITGLQPFFHQYVLCDIDFRVNIFAHSVFLNTHLYGVRDVVNIC